MACERICYTRPNPDPNPPPVFENPNLIPRILRSQENQGNSPSSHFDRHLQNSFQSELTSERTPNLSVITAASPSSPSTPQVILSTPPSSTHISIVIPTPPVITSTSTTMENRYTPLNLPANPGAMPKYYQSKIPSFEGTGTYTTQQHTNKMTNYFESYEIDDDGVRMKVFVQSLTGDVRT